MASSKTTEKVPVLQVAALTKEERQEVIELAEAENRTHSLMGAILIREALAVRKASSKDSKHATAR